MAKSYDLQEDKLTVKGIFLCRIQLAIVGFIGCICLYLMRINMSMGIVCMTIDPEENYTETGNRSALYRYSNHEDDRCPHDNEDEDSPETGEFDWDRELRGYVNSSFYVGYMLTQILGGWLAAKFGGKWVLGIGMLFSIVCTFLSPPGARLSVWCLCAMRIIIGLGQGVYLPAFHHMWSLWAPPLERTKLITFVLSGNTFGTILSYIFSGMLCEDLGWPWVFHMYGIVSSVWFVFWVIFAYSSPTDHPRITEEERNYIQTAIGEVGKRQSETCGSTPWLKMLISLPVWAAVVTYFCAAWGGHTSLTSYAQYMEDVLQFDIKQNGFYNSLPHVCKFVSTLVVAQIADCLRERECASTTWIRKIIQTVGMIPPAIFLIIVGYLDCFDWEWAIVMLCLAEACTACTRSGVVTVMADIAPRYGGVIFGICNTFGTIPGIVAPIVVGHVVETGTREEWQIIFYISAGIYVFGAIVFLVFGSAETQPWGLLDTEEDDDDDEMVVQCDHKTNDDVVGYANLSYDNQQFDKTKTKSNIYPDQVNTSVDVYTKLEKY